MNTQNYSKEAIKNRMYRHAMNFWGVKKVENLDPLIKLLLEALSCEIFGLSHEIEASQNRILDKVANMLTPDTLVSVQPAHAVCHVLPWEMRRNILTKDEGFYVDTASSGKDNKKNKVSFYPIKDTEIYGGDVRRMICNGAIYEMDATMTKEFHDRAPDRMLGKYNHTIWIGLNFEENIRQIKDLPLFFELPYRENKQMLYSLLAYSKWSINGHPLTVQQGIEQEEEDDDPESLFSICDTEKEIERDILSIYNNQFIRIANPFADKQSIPCLLPEEVKDYYSEKVIQSCVPLHWLRVDLPSNFTPDVLEELKVSINAIVVQNKELKHITVNVNELTAVVPLPAKSDEYFYAVASVKDVQSRLYTEIPYSGINNTTNNTYVIRRGGCERMNSRNVKEYLFRVLDLLQDRGAFIASLERDSFEKRIQEMNLLLNNMERTINNIKSATGSLSYLLVDLSEKAKILYVSYYTTACEQANNYPVGLQLTPWNGINIERESAYLLTTTRGGRGIPVSTNRFDIYKYALTTRDRIVTRSDIMNFFRKELGGYLEEVRIENGVMVSEKPQEGLVRSIDVHLTLKDYNEKDTQMVVEDLKIKLISRSLDRFNYRIFTHKA